MPTRPRRFYGSVRCSTVSHGTGCGLLTRHRVTWHSSSVSRDFSALWSTCPFLGVVAKLFQVPPPARSLHGGCTGNPEKTGGRGGGNVRHSPNPLHGAVRLCNAV